MTTATHLSPFHGISESPPASRLSCTRRRVRRLPRSPAFPRLQTVIANIAMAVAMTACRQTPAAGPSVIVHGERGATAVRVELALTAEQRAHGLMWRDHLDQDAGMLFVFPEMRDLAFWMKNTPLPLDIIFIEADGRVVSIAENTTPYSEKSLPSAGPAQYVLEVNGGFAKKHGIGPGTRVELPPDIGKAGRE